MMNQTKLFTFVAFSLLAVALVAGFASAETLATWALDDVENGSPSNVHANVNAGSFTFGPGLTSSAFSADGGRAGSWSESGFDATDYFQISLTAPAGQEFTISDINFGERRSGQGIRDYQVQWSKNADFSGATTLVTRAVPDDDTERNGDISGLNINVDSGETIYVRWFGYNAEASTGTWRINDDTLSVEGTVNAVGNAPSLNIVNVQDLTKSQSGVIRVENDGNTALSSISVTSSGSFSVNLNPSGLFSLGVGESRTITVSSTDLDDLNFGNNIVTLTASASGGVSDTFQYNVEGTFCQAGSVGGDLVINNIDINNEGEGDDDEWKLLDTIEVEVEVENEGDEDIDDVMVEIGLFDSTGDNMVNDLEFDNSDEEEVDLGEINDGDEETVTFRFRIPADMDDGNYKLAVKVYSDDLGEDVECSDQSGDLSDDLYESVSIDREDDEGKFIAFEDIVLTPSQATCGDLVSLRTDVYNIGDEDQEQVRIDLRNAELGIDESYEIRSDLDEGDNEEIRIDFQIPQDAEDKSYPLELTAYYDYSRGNYRESSDDVTRVILQVLGCSPSSGGNGGSMGGGNMAAVSAFLDSDAVAGQELIVQTTITNLLNSDVTFVVDGDGYQSWSTLDDVSDRILDLGPGESQEVTFTFIVDDDAEGQESFEIEIRNGNDVETKEVSVNIAAASSGSGTSFNLGDNTFLWVIGLVNVVLIILIIVVAVRISRR